MPKLGQHFLKNKSSLEKIVASLELTNGDFVVEVGPGHGELTELFLANLSADKEIEIVAIEKDPMLANALRKKFDTARNLEIIEGDVLKILKPLTENVRFLDKKWKLAGNIPYYITGKLLRVVGELEKKPERSTVMVQREVADRICSAPPNMNRLAASVQFWSSATIVAQVRREHFSPAPNVDSAVVLLKTRMGELNIEPRRYYKAVQALFSQPRKTILNNLADGAKIDKEEAQNGLKKLIIAPSARPQNLSIEQIEKVAELFF